MTDNAGVADAKLEQTHEGEFHGDHGDGSVPVVITSKTKLFAFCAALNSCNLGYDIGVSSEVGILVKDSMNLSDTQVEIFMGSLNLFAMVGALLSHIIADRSGRRGAFIVSYLLRSTPNCASLSCPLIQLESNPHPHSHTLFFSFTTDRSSILHYRGHYSISCPKLRNANGWPRFRRLGRWFWPRY